MDNLNERQSSPLDILLFPTWLHKKLSSRIEGLLYAFLFVGVFDMFFLTKPIEAGIFKGSIKELIPRIILFLLCSIIVGAVDVICTVVPISELAIFIGNRSEKFVCKRFSVILMKSYFISHLIFVIPYTFYMYSGIQWGSVNMSSSPQIRLVYSILVAILLIVPFLQLGIIYRTITTRTRIELFGRLILILAIYFWMKMSGSAVTYIATLLEQLFI